MATIYPDSHGEAERREWRLVAGVSGDEDEDEVEASVRELVDSGDDDDDGFMRCAKSVGAMIDWMDWML